MRLVHPIRDKKQVDAFLEALKDKDKKYYVLAYTGIYSGLRISDLLPLRVSDVKNNDNLYIGEKKTGKKRRVKVNRLLRAVLDDYIQDMEDDMYLFGRARDPYTPISRQYMHRVLSETGTYIGLPEPISNHSLRKTFGYHFYKQTKDVALLQQIFGHSAPSITLRYIGINDDIVDAAYDNFAI